MKRTFITAAVVILACSLLISADLPGDKIPYNRAQWKASHNSYAKKINVLTQLKDFHIRSIEFDFHTEKKKLLNKEEAPDGDFLVWACRVAYLEVRNYRRTAARDRLQFSDELLAVLAEERPSQLPHVSRRLLALQECMRQLSRGQQELLQHAYSQEQSVQTLAARLGRAVQTIYNRLVRLRRLLFDCVEKRLVTGEASA